MHKGHPHSDQYRCPPSPIYRTGTDLAVSPAVSHSGFDYVSIGKRLRISAGDNFHNLQHRFFRINYGNSMVPMYKVFDSWNNGSDADLEKMKARFKKEAS